MIMIRELFDKFVTLNGVEPDFVDVTVVWNDTKEEDYYTIALFAYDEENEKFDDSIFFYCSDGIAGLEKLEKDGNGEFHIVADESTYFYI